ncbi:hypothetical protein GCM10009584_03130 [Ornithinimicrobium humiphilum]|uniref:LVIVD repeat-containing protein n=1 Tax=Ornithinimicrobium humiphilum TaxID=125288 RepID=A0A543K7H9_9MICO|nr:hypothetical protein [Ornithinimicrobium humiphilum]TQM91048.1 LVIVD repeat-containing protein [Ornithinimicrobium humiphilum]
MSTRTQRLRRPGKWLGIVAAALLVPGLTATSAVADTDPREGLAPGFQNAGEASSNMTLLSHSQKPDGFYSPTNPGSLSYANSDMAYQGDYAFVGNFQGFQVYDVSDPAAPSLELSYVCPGGQGDLSVYGNLLFMSVEETRGRIDCGTAAPDAASRFRGVRIFDISNPLQPVQLPGVQTCAGSHTHSLLVPPVEDPETIYVYNSGTAGIRSASELAGCNGNSSLVDPTTTNFAIQVIEVPLAAPETARVVNNSRIFSVCGDNSCEGDYAAGALNGLPGSGLQPTYPVDDPRAPGGQSRSQASRCHDITLYPEIGLGAGACQGWGLLLDISDPVNPKRIDAVEDYNFAYWHSATFNNDGTKVIFTDEWGGGTSARCRVTDRPQWGANAIFDIVDRKMEWKSYYKLPVPQTTTENCVAHNGSLIPVPDRDIMVQAWYQGGSSVFDFTDSENPREIAFFDRGPMSGTSLQASGFWSTYWHNGYVYGSEIGRGFDTFELTPSADLSAAALAVAKTVTLETFNPQHQPKIEWPASFEMVDYRWELTEGLAKNKAANVEKMVEKARDFQASGKTAAAAAQLQAASNQLDTKNASQAALHQALTDLAGSLR